MSSWKADVTRFIQVRGGAGSGPLDLTLEVAEVVYQSEVQRGLCYLFTPNRETSLALTDGSEKELPRAAPFASGLRNQITLPVVDRRLFVSPGQRVVLWEEAGAFPEDASWRHRVMVRVVGEERSDRKVAEAASGSESVTEAVAESSPDLEDGGDLIIA